MGTYQALYWGWLKLAVAEERKIKNDEIKALKEQLDAVQRRKSVG